MNNPLASVDAIAVDALSVDAAPAPLAAAPVADAPAAAALTMRLELWQNLALIEDSLTGGLWRERPAPVFQSAAGSDPCATELPLAPASRADGPASLAALAAQAAQCTACGLALARHSVVFGTGVSSPLLMVIGEGPGAEEDRQGLPFVGASGRLLDKMLAAIQLSRHENCYIANIVKCRPPQNRQPSADESAACSPYLRAQIALLKPKVILCAGRTAAQGLLNSSEGINKLRGRELAYQGIPVVASYHPSALLRDETLKRPAWEDLKRLAAILASV